MIDQYKEEIAELKRQLEETPAASQQPSPVVSTELAEKAKVSVC